MNPLGLLIGYNTPVSDLFTLLDSPLVIVVAKLGSSPRAAASSFKVSNVSGAELTRLEIAVSIRPFEPVISLILMSLVADKLPTAVRDAFRSVPPLRVTRPDRIVSPIT